MKCRSINKGLIISTKEIILKKARQLFAKQGFDGVSVRSICEKANCNVSAISYHFGGKDELYKACLSEEGSNVLRLMESILTEPINQDDMVAKLRLYLLHHFEHGINNREIILMISRDVSSKTAVESIHTIFKQVPETMNSFFRTAQEKGFIKSTIDTSYLGDFFLGPLFMQVLFAEKLMGLKDVTDSRYREQFVSELLQNLLTGILSD